MSVNEALAIRLSGDMSQAKLDQVRGLLSLKDRGRLSDDEDCDFGYRYLKRDGDDFTKLTLFRYPEGAWHVVLTYAGEPPSADLVEQCRSDVVTAAQHVGLTLESSWARSGGQREGG